MNEWKIKAYLPGGMGMPAYDGFVDARGDTEEEAIKNGKQKIQKVHGFREIRIESIQRKYK